MRDAIRQISPAATTLTSLYKAVGNRNRINKILVTNRDSTDGSFRIVLSIGGEDLAAYQYICYDTPVLANDLKFIDTGVDVPKWAELKVYSSSGLLTFMCFAEEELQ